MTPEIRTYIKQSCLVVVICLGSFGSVKSQLYNYALFESGLIQKSYKSQILGKYFYNYQNVNEQLMTNENYLLQYLRSNLESQKKFETYLYPSLRKYTVETYKFEVVFKMPDFPEIVFEPSNFKQKEIEEYSTLMRSNRLSKKYAVAFENRQPIAEARQAFIFSHPHELERSSDSIPDAPILGRGGYLQRRSASEGINVLLRNNTYDTQPSLQKVKFSSGPWTLKGTENVQLSQGYVDNWVKGGESSITLSSDLRLNANYKAGKHEWENYIIHKVGVISTENEEGRVNTDLIEINTKYGHRASDKWYYSFLYNFKTQFFYGYESSDDEKLEPVSGFMAPAYMSFAIGMDYKPNSNFTLLLSPLTSRISLVSDTVKFDQTKFGIPSNKAHLTVNGISVVNNFAFDLSKEIKLSSRLDAFYQYLGKIEDGTTRQVQIDWEVILDMKINRFLTTRILAHLRYFNNESEQVQFKENFNIAFQYHF